MLIDNKASKQGGSEAYQILAAAVSHCFHCAALALHLPPLQTRHRRLSLMMMMLLMMTMTTTTTTMMSLSVYNISRMRELMSMIQQASTRVRVYQ